jgi:hypothetical protein
MNGEYGAIFQKGKQVGGFLNWNMSFGVEETTAASGQMKSYTVTRWRVVASPYYWTADTDGDVYTVDFYIYYEGMLLLASRNDVEIDRNLSEPVNRWIDKRLEIT